MLRIYISRHCFGCAVALELAKHVREQHPVLALEVIDVDAAGSDVPAHVIGTPVYAWNDRVLFLGNPSRAELLQRLEGLYGGEERAGA